MEPSVQIALIGGITGTIAAVIAAAVSIFTLFHTKQQGKDIIATRESIKAVEAATDGMSTQLQKIAGEKGFDRGFDIGMKSGSPGPTGPQGETGATGETGAAGPKGDTGKRA